MKLRPIAAALAAVSVMAAGSASAAMPTHAYVSHSPKGANKGCASPGFNTVQAAVDAVAPNGTVYLCGSEPFLEQVFLTKSVTVTGSPDASIGSPAIGGFADASHFPSQFAAKNLVVPQAIVVVTGTDTKATIKGIDINGRLPGNGGCTNREYGVLVLEGFLHLTQAGVIDARDANENLNGCQFGVGVQVGSTHWLKLDGTLTDANVTADAEIDNTTVSGYAKNGIVIDGIDSDGDIHDNTVSGSGPTSVSAQNGIEIVRGATGEVYNNSISANQYTGSGEASSTGVLLYGGCVNVTNRVDPLVTHVDVHNNTAVNNDVGISMNNYSPDCVAPATTQTKNRAYNNNISNSAVTNVSGFGGGRGYQAGIADVGNRDGIANNKISGAGYALIDTPAAWVRPIDVTSTIRPNVRQRP